jgi:hypothetical protein
MCLTIHFGMGAEKSVICARVNATKTRPEQISSFCHAVLPTRGGTRNWDLDSQPEK